MTIHELKSAVIAEAEALMNKNEMTGRIADDVNICVSLDGWEHRNDYWWGMFGSMNLNHYDGGDIDEIRITEDGMVYININLYRYEHNTKS